MLSAPRLKNVEYFAKELTFTPQINRKSKQLDAKRQAAGLNRVDQLRMQVVSI